MTASDNLDKEPFEALELFWRKGGAVFTLGFFLGVLLWLTSFALTGDEEPWDGNFLYYCSALFFMGVAAALPNPRKFWLAPIGLYAGQVIYIVVAMPLGPLFLVGLIEMIFFTLLALLGALIPFAVWKFRTSRRPIEP